MGAVAWAIRRRSVFRPRSSNRTCRFEKKRTLASPRPDAPHGHGSDQTVYPLNPKLVEVGWFRTQSLPSGRCSCAAPSSFPFCCYGHCRCRAQQAPPRFLYMARSTRSTTECAPSRLPRPPMALSRAVGGAATTTRNLTSAKDRQSCVKGRLSRRRWSFLRGCEQRLRCVAGFVFLLKAPKPFLEARTIVVSETRQRLSRGNRLTRNDHENRLYRTGLHL
jgi:hypothetical protein